MKDKTKRSDEFEETMLIFKEMKNVLKYEHKLKMIRLVKERENQSVFHDESLQRTRIKEAGIKRVQDHKDRRGY